MQLDLRAAPALLKLEDFVGPSLDDVPIWLNRPDYGWRPHEIEEVHGQSSSLNGFSRPGAKLLTSGFGAAVSTL